jgi:hypothetical protein
MCLYVDRDRTEELKKSRKKGITCYKFVDLLRNDVVAPYRRTSYDLSSNELKINQNLRPPEKYIIEEHFWGRGKVGIVRRGIHAYTFPHRPLIGAYRIKCYGYIEDLIAVSIYGDVAFTKLYIDPKDYQRLLDHKYGEGNYTYDYA